MRGLGDFWWFNSVGIWVSPLGGVGLVGGVFWVGLALEIFGVGII